MSIPKVVPWSRMASRALVLHSYFTQKEKEEEKMVSLLIELVLFKRFFQKFDISILKIELLL